MMIKQFRFNHPGVGDVFAYLLFDEASKEAIVVDGGAAEEILSFLKEQKLILKIVTNTHRHNDHISGDEALIEATAAVYISPEEAADKGALPLGKESVKIIATPGHSDDSVVLKWNEILITGDTLFTGTIGNCYTEDYETYFKSLKSVIALGGNCRIYPGHDLREYAMGVAAKLDPQNKEISPYLSRRNPEDEWSTLSEELKVNPFIRWNDSALNNAIDGTQESPGSDFERFRALMKLH